MCSWPQPPRSYSIVIESRDGIKTVDIVDVDGVAHAMSVLRDKYSFDEWRVVNIAAVAMSPTCVHGSPATTGNE